MLRSNQLLRTLATAKGDLRSLSTVNVKKYPRPLKTRKSGLDILHDPLWNKSLAFSYSERDRLGLRGLIPPAVRTLESQVARCLGHMRACVDDVAKNLYLQDLHNRNETLYHRLLVDHIEEIAPLVYTPTVGVVCQQFGHRFNRSRGMYFSLNDRGSFSTMVHNWPHEDVHVIVVTDGSRILGLGDLGVHGMGIPIGKLALYCAAGGIAPHRVLPITLDVGTNNEELLKDPSYVGIQQKRIVGDEYFEFLEEFMQAIAGRWPNAVIQFEDFETAKAVPLLQKYRDRYHCFNDDIQGTGCVTLAGIIAAARAAKGTIKDMRFMCVGAGSAGLGVCSQILDGLIMEGLTREEALQRFAVFSEKGVLGKADGKFGSPHHAADVSSDMLQWCNPAFSDGDKLVDVIHKFKPTVLLGLSTKGGLFNENVIKAMHSHCPNPIIMPMSNPTSKAECTAEDAYKWTNGAAIVASGSPFPPVTLADGTVKVPSQCNNMYIFPALGLAASVGGIVRITDKMLYTAAVACADSMTEQSYAEGRTFPKIQDIREVSLQVATAIVKEAMTEGLCTKIDPAKVTDDEYIRNFIARKMYFPSYVPLL